jgi:hypothetical protein
VLGSLRTSCVLDKAVPESAVNKMSSQFIDILLYGIAYEVKEQLCMCVLR